MQLLVNTIARTDYERGDILAVVPDTHIWGREESMAIWLGDGRAAEDFPNPHLGILRMPSEPVDLNLADPFLEDALDEGQPSTEVLKQRLWYVDIDALPPGVANSLTSPGGDAQVGRNRRSAIKNKYDGSSLPLRNESDGNTRHRHTNTNPRDRVVGR